MVKEYDKAVPQVGESSVLIAKTDPHPYYYIDSMMQS